MDSLLTQSFGYPTSSQTWTTGSKRLREIHEAQKNEHVLSSVYWIKSPESDAKVWASRQPWFPLLTCTPKKNSMAPSAPKSYDVSYEHATKKNFLGVPRFLGLSLFGKPERDIRALGNPATFSFKGDRPLRDYQEAARLAALSRLEEWGGATIIADCGGGKSAIALAIAASLGKKTLVLCNRTFLMHQWAADIQGKGWTWADDNKAVDDAFENKQSLRRIKCDACKLITLNPGPACACGFHFVNQAIGTVEPRPSWISGTTAGWMQGPLEKCQLDADIVVASIESVAQCGYPRSILEQFGLVIVDEMHHLGALTLSQVLPLLPSRYILGISATPERADGLEHVLYWLAGPTAFVYKRIPSVTGGPAGSVRVRIIKIEGAGADILGVTGKLNFAAMVNALAANDARNAKIIQLTQQKLREGRRKILLVTSLVAHAHFLASSLASLESARVCVIHGGCKPALVAEAKGEGARIVVATFQFLEEGYDDPRIDTLVLTLPRSRVQQVVGRAERTHEGKLLPEVLDIVDCGSQIFKAMGRKREVFYKSRAFEILHDR